MLKMDSGAAKQRLGGLALLVLLAACAYIGSCGGDERTVSVAVSRTEYVPAEWTLIGEDSAQARLEAERRQEMDMLRAIAQDEHADEETKKTALDQIGQIAMRMETEAQARACLEEMGILQPGVICGAQMLTIVLAPEQALEADSVRIMDAVCSATGLDAADIKIILSKK